MTTSDNTKLMATAAGAAIAGAALAVAAMKMTASKSEGDSSFTTLKKNVSFIYEDKESDLVGGGSKLLFPHNHEEKMRRRISTRAAVEEENLAPRRSVTVRVPATSANMGPGCKYELSTVYCSGVCIVVSMCGNIILFSNRFSTDY
jgi:hypothetical protein